MVPTGAYLPPTAPAPEARPHPGLARGWASPAKFTVTATMMMMIPMMMKVMLSSRARRPSLRAPSMSPCCTLLRDCGERGWQGPQKAVLTALWGPLEHTRSHCSPHSSCLLGGEEVAWIQRAGTPNQAWPSPAEDSWKQNQAMQSHRTTGWQSGDGGPEREAQVQAALSWWEQISQAPPDPRPRLTAVAAPRG